MLVIRTNGTSGTNGTGLDRHMSEKNPKGPLTTGEVAQYCHVTHRAVLKWVESGKLKAYRTPGKHSRVSVENFVAFLHLYNMPVPAELQPPAALKKILIVDDDPGIVHSLERTLMLENKYEIATALDGFEAGRKFSTFKPDFIILDIRMPRLDGYEVCAHIRKDPKNKNTKILAISGMSEPHEIKKILELGANDYLQKPFSNEALQGKIKEMLG
jgi:excisionase family DNA binding protein